MNQAFGITGRIIFNDKGKNMISLNKFSKKSLTARDLFLGEFNSGSNVFLAGSNMHVKRELYKYYWWIYPADSIYPTAKDIFYKLEHRLSTKEAMDMMETLRSQGIQFAYVNTQLHRLGCTIWDYDKLKDKQPDITFAPSYDDDCDLDWNGYK